MTLALRHPVPAYMDFPAMNQPLKKLAIQLPEHERGRDPKTLKRLDVLNARLSRPPTARGRLSATEARQEDLDERDRIEAMPHLHADQQWLRDATAETAKLAKARGEEVEDTGGVKRMLDRDPLLSLARSSHITPEQLEVAFEVRGLYDSRAQDAGAIEYSGMPGGGAHDNDKFVKERLKRAKASEKIGRIERAILVNCSAEPVCLVTVRWVCERGLSMSSMGKGRAFERNCAAFARALDVADAVLRRRL